MFEKIIIGIIFCATVIYLGRYIKNKFKSGDQCKSCDPQKPACKCDGRDNK